MKETPTHYVAILVIALILSQQLSFAQTDDFNDGNLTANPAWQGNTANFQINTNSPIPGGTATSDGSFLASNPAIRKATLLTPSTNTDEWKFSLASSNYDPSGIDQFGVVLMSDVFFSGDYAGANTNWNGYYLKVGANGNNDYLELGRATMGTTKATLTTIKEFTIIGILDPGALQAGLNLRITRSAAGEFEVFYSTGFNYSIIPTTSAGIITDNTHKLSSYFGVFTDFKNNSTGRIYLDNIQNANYQNIYTWNGGTSGDWNTSTNWTPSRLIPYSSDVLEFNSGTSITATNVPTQNITSLVISNNSDVNLQAASSGSVLTIQGDNPNASVDLSIPSGSALNITGTNQLNVFLYTNATASVSGSMAFSGAGHTIDAATASAINFNNGSLFTQGTGHTGTGIFTETGMSGTVIFNQGATFIFDAANGSNPFALAQPASKVVFNAGSVYRHLRSRILSLAGRSYANLELDFGNSNSMAITVGNTACTIANLEMKSGNINITTALPLNILGNLILTGGNFNYSPNPVSILKFNGGSSSQTISGTGTITLGANATVEINNPNGVNLQRNLDINGTLTFTSGSLQTGSNILTLGPIASVTGETDGTNTKYVVGLLRTTRTVGTGTSSFGNMGVTIAADPANSDNIGDVTITRQTSSAAVTTVDGKTSIARNWDIMPGSQPVNGRSITFTWLPSEDNGKDLTTAQVWKQSIATGPWERVGSQQNIATTIPRSITVTTTSFSKWTVSDENNPLPVDLLSFKAEYIRSFAELTWTTTSEKDNAGFQIQRSRDGTQYEIIEYVEATSQPQHINTYTYKDNTVNQDSYYRLRQLDKDGKFTESKSVFVKVTTKNDLALIISPNPTESEVSLELPNSDEIQLHLLSVTGQPLLEVSGGILNAVDKLNKKLITLSIGVYIIRVRQKEKQYQAKLVKW